MQLDDRRIAGSPITVGITGFWNGPVATTTLWASIMPAEVVARKPSP
jgi:hypothetical protein